MRSFTIVLMSMLVTLLASACAAAQPITEPVSVIEAFYEALNDGDLDAAMSFVGDDAKFIIDTLYTGKTEIRDRLQEELDLGRHSELTDLREDGDKVSFVDKQTLGGATYEAQVEAVVQEGLIVSLIVFGL